ncbi:MAG TPA: hypothetical protein VN176_18250 [Verrucomicrobiae bacterium]|jgi:hypothetical protein|nr:hypothetical protein [Verrucomicrobiae bacterium]
MTNETKQIELRAKLEHLRAILAEGQCAHGYVTLFDEFVREAEFDLALHCVCDYLLEKETAPPAATVTDQIHALHVAMGLNDDCINRLCEKVAAFSDLGTVVKGEGPSEP